MPAQGVIAGLEAGGAPVSDFRSWPHLPKSERAYVIKPSGFSQLAWGSRGVKNRRRSDARGVDRRIDVALTSFDRTPYIFSDFHKGKRVRQSYFDRDRDEIREYDGRVRLCPYYFVTGEESVAAGRRSRDDRAGRQAPHSRHDRRGDDLFDLRNRGYVGSEVRAPID